MGEKRPKWKKTKHHIGSEEYMDNERSAYYAEKDNDYVSAAREFEQAGIEFIRDGQYPEDAATDFELAAKNLRKYRDQLMDNPKADREIHNEIYRVGKKIYRLEKRAKIFRKHGFYYTPKHFEKRREIAKKKGFRTYRQSIEDRINRENESHPFLIISLVGFIFGILLLSPNFTGNVIGNSNTTNFIGACLLIIGLIAGSFWLRNKR